MKFQSTKIIELGSCAFRQWKADHSHCKFIHGYRLIAKFWFDCSTLDDKNWVVDFGGLKDLKKVLEHQFDHTLCVAADDPLLSYFRQLHDLGACDLRIMDKGVGIERTADWCFDVADSHVRGITNNRCWVDRVEVWEHEKNSAIATYAPVSERIDRGNNSLTPLHTTVAAPSPEVQQAVNNNTQSAATQAKVDVIRPVNVGNTVSSGWGDVFKGTTWGS